jgi:peptide/nickel transport system ATP-binding protein
MRQRVVIALAICAEPELIIADEPTTALDVSVQAQIISLIKRLGRDHGTAVMLVTHDMGVIAETFGPRRGDVFRAHRRDRPGAGRRAQSAASLRQGTDGRDPDAGLARTSGWCRSAGSMPRLSAIPPGCSFNPRCGFAFDRCRVERPEPIRHGNAVGGLPSLRRHGQGQRGMSLCRRQ